MNIPPKTFKDLFDFYNEYVKPLYSDIQIEGVLPNETLFEINAALDHISRYYSFNESEEYVVNRAYGHFKRSCLDIFKIKIKLALEYYEKLCQVDTSVIDYGDFDNKLIAIVAKMKKEAAIARKFEGDKRGDHEQKVLAFEKWQPAYNDAITIINDFYNNPKVDWARKRMRQFNTKQFIFSITASFIAGVVFWIVIRLLFPSSPI